MLKQTPNHFQMTNVTCSMFDEDQTAKSYGVLICIYFSMHDINSKLFWGGGRTFPFVLPYFSVVFGQSGSSGGGNNLSLILGLPIGLGWCAFGDVAYCC